MQSTTARYYNLRELGQPVVAGFSTHPHWDHLLWHARLGAAPRYGTARCAATARDRLSDPRAKARVAELISPDIAEQVPLDLLGLIAALPAEMALLIGERGVLVAGGADQVRARIDQDRAYVHAVRDAHVPDDPRVGPSAKDGWDWVGGVHTGQLQRLARRSERDGTPG